MLDMILAFYHDQAAWLLPVLIFLARILDVSIGTLRIVFLSRGMRLLAPLCGFFEVLIWLVAVSRIMGNLSSWVNYIAYAGGFAAGNYVGMYIENRLAMGLLSVMVFARESADALLEHLERERFGITRMGARGIQGEVHMILLIIRRRDLGAVTNILKQYQPDAFSVVNDVRDAVGGVFPLEHYKIERRRKLFGGWRKER